MEMDEIATKFMKDDSSRGDILTEAQSKAKSLENPKYVSYVCTMCVTVVFYDPVLICM